MIRSIPIRSASTLNGRNRASDWSFLDIGPIPAARIQLELLLMSVKALYPGTFDPPTNGHVDLIQRGAKLF